MIYSFFTIIIKINLERNGQKVEGIERKEDQIRESIKFSNDTVEIEHG